MGIKQVSKCECDLCDGSGEAPAGQIPKGWVKFDTDGMIDREWITHIVCASCVKRIEAAKKKV